MQWLYSTCLCMYYGNLGTCRNCPAYQGVFIFQIILYDKVPFGITTIIISAWIVQASLFSSMAVFTLTSNLCHICSASEKSMKVEISLTLIFLSKGYPNGMPFVRHREM